MKQFRNIFLSSLALLTGITGCNKSELYDVTIPQSQAHFANQTSDVFEVLSAASSYKVPIGVTDVSNVDRTVTFTVTSPTGAVLGTHYTLSKTVATIKAGTALDSIEVKGIVSQYNAGRKDTLIFSLAGQSFKAASYNDTFKLLLRGPCFEGDITLDVLNGLRGDYTNTNETFGTSPYGPYKTTISAVALTSPTTGRITVTNIWDNGWGPISFDLDWTNPANRTATVISQNAIPGSNAGDINSTYNGQTLMVRPFAGQPGTFSACRSTFSLKMQLGPTGVGFFGVLYTVNLAR